MKELSWLRVKRDREDQRQHTGASIKGSYSYNLSSWKMNLFALVVPVLEGKLGKY